MAMHLSLGGIVRYFRCPETYRLKPHGCGAGPFNGTQAYLDHGMKCPRCQASLKPYHPVRTPRIGDTCSVTALDGERYCTAPTVAGAYCKRHEYLAVR